MSWGKFLDVEHGSVSRDVERGLRYMHYMGTIALR